MGRNRAISIGINQYEFSQSLKYAKRDAQLMRDFLVKEAGFDGVFLLSDDLPPDKGMSTRPSFTNLRRVLKTMFEKPSMEAGDNFWFFFSGHGMRHKGCDYLMACDSDPGDVEHTAISINYVTERLGRCGADNIVLILDACREGEGSKSGEGVGNQAAQVAREKGVITIFSCSPDEYSYEIDDLQQGIFTKALLEGLGAQEGRCATVEQLNDYLKGRVPDLIRQYKKSDTRQTPDIIAEPASKYHLILCPQYATKADVAMMKNDAFYAEVHKDLDLAKQLWIRVLAVSPADMQAVNAIERIAVAKIQAEVIPDQPSSKNSAATDKYSQPAPPNPTPIRALPILDPLTSENPTKTNKSPQAAPSNPTSIEPDVPLKSERGVDYTKLRDLLATEEWAEADEETNRIMLLIAGKEKIGYFDIFDIKENFCEDFRTINQLWIKYSNDNFGFSIQKFIRDEVNEKLYEFLDRVGWDLDWGMGDKYRGNPHTFPKGHFPGRWFFGWYSYQGEDLGMARKPATEDMLWFNLDCF
ncbi:GUN4 domain-containing protein [Microcoleus sp. PH2017_05_CCC_O_A]|uniref:GUN4 domain-containing protein n=1 Tax=Microcoleus sp. PH2017_05_CCC_O_A TaxID=2798816 RepID=UPI001DCEC482|nr:GUN4 domain-containing protein [Microcoleus sp. PH2017_05_CCC_O_A]MCC3436370.1 GUN4 domain-containing protein [Microcoleus sp. PH2017_05_CCC_O_A]TAG58601.1 MAG: hypothetical protein EAZ28_14260 [Oscillatoriales cyanobacterium]